MQELDSRIVPLLCTWVGMFERSCAPKQRSWPEVAYSFEKCGMVYHIEPLGFMLEHATGPRELSDWQSNALIIGEAFWDLYSTDSPKYCKRFPHWRCELLWTFATLEATEEDSYRWKQLLSRHAISKRKWQNILLDLQEAAEARGFVTEIKDVYPDSR